jgi:hypothetical protein
VEAIFSRQTFRFSTPLPALKNATFGATVALDRCMQNVMYGAETRLLTRVMRPSMLVVVADTCMHAYGSHKVDIFSKVAPHEHAVL